MEKLFEKIINATESYLKDSKISTMVLGVSGGIDSTVVASICHEIVRRNPEFKLVGVSLPCTTNGDDENSAALKVMKAFCDEWHVVNLQSTFEQVRDLCEKTVSSTPTSIGNIKARLRMTFLYNLAGVTKGIVMDTDNLTEHYLGFFTIHGDQGDLNPIGTLWKSRVYELANHLYSTYLEKGEFDKAKAILSSLHLTPTDGNGVAEGGDLAQIMPGHTYEDVDLVLKFVLANGYTDESKIKDFLGRYHWIDEESFWKVTNRFKATGFKRQILPHVPTPRD